MSSAAPPVAEKIAAYIDQESYESIPQSVIEKAKYLLLDSVGVTVGGTQLRPGSAVVDFWAEQGGRPVAAVPTVSERLPAPQAACVNGHLANVLNYDDTYTNKGVGHPGATVVPSTLAVGDKRDVDGQSLLEALVLGYEVSVRVCDATAPTPDRAEEVLGMSTWQIFGAAVSTSKLLESSAEQITNALGLAGVTAPVPSVRKLGIGNEGFHWLKNNFGWAAMGGVRAGMLADRGGKGNRTIFDGDQGFWRMSGSDRFDRHTLIADQGEHYRINDVSIKPYPSGRWTHAALDSLRQLKPHIDDVDDIEHIEVEAFDEVMNETAYPETTLDPPISVPYLLSVSLHDYDIGFEWLSADQIDDDDVRALAEKVSVEEAEKMTSRYDEKGQISSRVTVIMADGTEHTERTVDPRGGTANPLSGPNIESKFLTLTEPILGKSNARELRNRILSIDEEPSVRDVTDLLRG